MKSSKKIYGTAKIISIMAMNKFQSIENLQNGG